MSHSIFTNLGSNQDPDDYRDQAVDREREAAPILGYCSWHFGGKGSWYDRVTGEAVASNQKPASHGICAACSAEQVEIARKNREALPKSNPTQP